MLKAKILAEDFFILGNGKPFNAGENTFRFSENFVLNTYVYSALKKFFSPLEIRMILIHKNFDNTYYFPFPLDYVYYLPKNRILQPIVNVKIPNIEILKEDDFRKYLLGKHFEEDFGVKSLKTKKLKKLKSNKESLKELKDKIVEKLKSLKNIKFKTSILETGLEIDRNSRTAKQGNIYIQNRNYLSSEEGYEDIEIVVFFDSKVQSNKEKYFSVLGAESKVANIVIENTNGFDKKFPPQSDIKSQIQKSKYFKIILLTPTNYPPDIDGAKIVVQLTGKPIAFSGWFNVYEEDKKIDSFPSRLFKLIPAGSVFYYKINDEIANDENKLKEFLEKLFKDYWLKPSFFVSEYPYFERASDGTNPLGFGLSIIGVAQVEE